LEKNIHSKTSVYLPHFVRLSVAFILPLDKISSKLLPMNDKRTKTCYCQIKIGKEKLNAQILSNVHSVHTYSELYHIMIKNKTVPSMYIQHFRFKSISANVELRLNKHYVINHLYLCMDVKGFKRTGRKKNTESKSCPIIIT